MARLTRKNIKVFAGNATNNGVFGSLQAENPVITTNVEQIQSLPAWDVGWDSATMTSEKLPPLEEFQGIQYVTTYQQAYLMQEGMPEWASTVTYYKGSLAKEVTSNGFRIYCSLTDNNENHLLSDTSNWKKIMDSQDLYAFDDSVVHKAGNETITGTKTFSQDINIKNNVPIVNLQDDDVVKGTNPANEQAWRINGQDSVGNDANHRIGEFTTRLTANGTIWSGIIAYKNEADSTDSASIRVLYPTSGSPYTYAPTPTSTTSTSSTQIATTGWINSTGNNVVHRTDNETIAGTKTFNASPLVPTATSGDSSTKAASTAFVASADNALQTQINTKAANNAVVHLTGNETIAGTKTFSSTISGSINGNAATVTNGVYTTGNQTIGGTKTFSAATYGKASDAVNSILTTVSINKSTNGKLKLGNGFMIQWFTQNLSSSVSFPTPFDNECFFVAAVDTQANTMGVTNITKTGFEYLQSYNLPRACRVFAIGH